MSDENNVVDLDALTPQPRYVRFGDQNIEVKPPTTADVLTLGFLGQKLQGTQELSPEQIEKLVADMTAQVIKCVPELTGKTLNTAQLLKLVEVISEMGMPTEAKELEAKGISPKTPKENP